MDLYGLREKKDNKILCQIAILNRDFIGTIDIFQKLYFKSLATTRVQ